MAHDPLQEADDRESALRELRALDAAIDELRDRLDALESRRDDVALELASR